MYFYRTFDVNGTQVDEAYTFYESIDLAKTIAKDSLRVFSNILYPVEIRVYYEDKETIAATHYLSKGDVDVVEPKYPEYIMNKVRQSLGLEAWDTKRDEEINLLPKHNIFGACLEWEGIIGYGYTIKDWVKDIYGVELT